jgi:hypothetical protein
MISKAVSCSVPKPYWYCIPEKLNSSRDLGVGNAALRSSRTFLFSALMKSTISNIFSIKDTCFGVATTENVSIVELENIIKWALLRKAASMFWYSWEFIYDTASIQVNT